MRNLLKILLLLVLFRTHIFPQSGKNFSVAFRLNYTTDSKMSFIQKNSIVPFTFNRTYLYDILSYGIDLRYYFLESLSIGLSTEFMEKITDEGYIDVIYESQKRLMLIDDGFRFIPVELSLHYKLPFSTEKFGFFMGGGIAVYFGEQERKFADITLKNTSQYFAYGIQVSAGLEYLIRQNLAFRFEMIFRDPEVKVIGDYSASEFKYKGNTAYLLEDNFETRINIDGTTYSFGLAYFF